MMNSEITPSDQELREQVYRVFAAEEQLRQCRLRVGVAGGFVHLAGKVDTLDLYFRTEDLVKSIAGVKGVINRLEAPGAPSPSRVIHLDARNPSALIQPHSHKPKENKNER